MEVAVRPDDVVENEVLPKLIEADLVVLVTSLYYYGINAALKAVIDRFYPTTTSCTAASRPSP